MSESAEIGHSGPAVSFARLVTYFLRLGAMGFGGSRGPRQRLRGFIRGITVTVVGVLVGTTYLVARTAIGDGLTVAIAVLSLLVLALWKRCPDPLLVAVGALAT